MAINMKKHWIFMVPAAILGIALFTFLGGEAVMHLWNWLLPPLFGWGVLTFWQALGMLALCRILFGGWGHGGGNKRNRRWKDKMEEGCYQKMTPEERENFRAAVKTKWGRGAEDGANAQ